MSNRILGCVLGGIIFLLTACSADSDIYLEEHGTEVLEETVVLEEVTESMYYVYICGAVCNPGVYELPPRSRIYEVIELAGGLLDEAEVNSINQAEVVTDGQMIRIFTKQEMEEQIILDQSQEKDDGLVNVNTATAGELMTLPGIGASKAEAILSYREANGDFSDIEELKRVAGIKDGIFNQIKEHIKVGN